MSMDLAPVALDRRPAYEQVAEQLRAAILEGVLAPGAPLPPERELSARFGVGRTTVREALRLLQTKGLAVADGPTSPLRVVAPDAVPTAPLRDTLVHLLALGRVPLDDLIGLRVALEGAGAEQAAAARRPDLADARRELEAMRAAADADADVAGPDLDAFEAADVRFHLAVVRASGNEALSLVMLAVRDAISAALRTKLEANRRALRTTLRTLVAEHAALLDAIERGDGDAARRLAGEHLMRFYGRRPGSGRARR
jgi:GntR family transcriptional regulator, transcriptional repressor for pyruvate dehydrogenase complex